MPDRRSGIPKVRFAFGKNWASYAALIGEPEIAEAEQGLLKLIPEAELRGRSFLDIGCGSGLHALASARLGVSRIVAIDYDPDSAITASALLERFGVAIPWQAERADLFDLDPTGIGTFDIVYSWGVLHHTGNMWGAIDKAASLVAPSGLFAFAIYRSTRMDAFWKREKRWYSQGSPRVQRMARNAYLAAFRLGCALGRKNYREMVAKRSRRGMDFHHDIHDWLGGYPYETALSPEIEARMDVLGFEPERVFARPMQFGLLGSGCDEYVYRRVPAASGPGSAALSGS